MTTAKEWLQVAQHLPEGWKATTFIPRACCLAKISDCEAWFAVCPEDRPKMLRTERDRRIRVDDFSRVTKHSKSGETLERIQAGDFATLAYATNQHSGLWFVMPPIPGRVFHRSR